MLLKESMRMSSIVRGLWLRSNLNRLICRKVHGTLSSIDGNSTHSPDLKIDAKLATRDPLVKNFFVGIVDKELLGFPEVICREDMHELNEYIKQIRSIFLSELYLERTETERLEHILALGLYGQNVPREYGGKGYKWSESLYVTEPEINDTTFSFGIVSHRVVVDLLNAFGSNEQKEKYLKQMAKGTLVATEAVYEDFNFEDDLPSTLAQYDDETNHWILNGKKTNVVTGALPKNSKYLFLVTAQTVPTQLNAEKCMSLFLIESTQPGVKFIQTNTTSSSNVMIQSISFENVKILDECRIGNPNNIQKITEFLFKSNRLRFSMVCFGLAKRILNNISNYCISHKISGISLKDMDLPKVRLANGFSSVYAMESMIYLTAGLMDEFENQDVSIESAITKYFSLTNLKNLAVEPMDYVGSKWLKECDGGNEIFSSFLQLYTNTEMLDSLRMFIGLSGIQHAGAIIHPIVNKLRNPLFNPGYIFSKLLNQSSIDNPKTNLKLNENVHPSLAPAAQCIEHSVLRLQHCTELLLTRYGNDIVEHHKELERLSAMCSLIYAMFASVSRASRSYCIGLSNADYELLIASSICANGQNDIKIVCNEILNGHYLNNDINLLRLGKQVEKYKGYFPNSPLAYNF